MGSGVGPRGGGGSGVGPWGRESGVGPRVASAKPEGETGGGKGLVSLKLRGIGCQGDLRGFFIGVGGTSEVGGVWGVEWGAQSNT